MSLTEFSAESGNAIETTDEADVADKFAHLELDAIVPSLTNPRSNFDEGKLAELAESIRASGVHQAILVRPLPASRLDETSRKLGRKQRETHEIVSGERRWRASKLAGKHTIPAIVRVMTDVAVLEAQIIENLQRADLSELEEAEGYQRLVDQTGVAKEDIGVKIGKSRGYVYARLKLLDLDTAGREALRRGQIDASKALLIARIPDDKLQIKALGQATGEDNYGRALSVKDLQTWLQTNVMLSLKRTSFDIKDVTLREGAGACGECPKRTGANPDLFADVESADLCTDPACYHDKERAAADRRFEEAKREGKKVIEEAQAVKLMKAGDYRNWLKGYYELDARPDYNLDVDGNTLRRALGKHCPEAVLVKHPESGDVVEVLPIDQVKRIIREHALTRFEKQAARQAQKGDEAKVKAKQLPIEQRPEFGDRWQKTSILRTVEFVKREPAVGTPDLLRAWLIDEGENDYECAAALQLALEANDSRNLSASIANLPDAEIPRLFVLYMLHRTAVRYNAWSDKEAKRQGPRSALFEILHMAGVDVAEIKAQTKREIESEDRVAEEAKRATKAVDPAPAPKKAKAKKSTAQPAAQAPRAKKSKEQAQREISDALQALEGQGEDQAPDGAGQEAAAASTAAEAAPSFEISDLARVKAGSKGPNGKLLKSIGRVCRIVGIGDDGRVHLKYGERRHEMLVLEPEHLEAYAALPAIGNQVRVLRVGIAPGQDKLLWRTGIVEACDRTSGWRVRFAAGSGSPDAVSDYIEYFETNCLEVLA